VTTYSPLKRLPTDSILTDDPAMIDLDHWHAFEQEQPDTFAGMYQFWIAKG